MRIVFMASAKQIAWRKKFARMSKAGKFRKKKVRKEKTKFLEKSLSFAELDKKIAFSKTNEEKRRWRKIKNAKTIRSLS